MPPESKVLGNRTRLLLDSRGRGRDEVVQSDFYHDPFLFKDLIHEWRFVDRMEA